MRPTASLLVVLVLAACGDVGTAERLSSKETLDGIDVPTIGTVGDFPDPAHRHVVNVTADGRIVIEGKAFATYGELVDELTRRGAATRGELIVGTNPAKYLSDASAVLRVDGAVPWGVAQWMFQACAESSVWRISFAVRHDVDGSDGAIGMPLQKDHGGCGDPSDHVWRTIDVAPGIEDGSPSAVYAKLAESPALQQGKMGARLRIDRTCPTRIVIASIDAVVRVGASAVDVEFERRVPRRDETFAGAFGTFRAPGATWSFRLDEKPVPSSVATSRVPAVARIRGDTIVPSFVISARSDPPPVEDVLAPEPTRPPDVVPK